ncbi:MAG: glycosyltransferase, partial [Deltaproteobacteria bacterium]
FETDQDETPPVAGNRALRLASGRYLALFTAAALFSSESLLQLVTFLDDRPEVGLAGPRLQTAGGFTLPTAGSFPSPLRLLATAARTSVGIQPGLLTAPSFSREVDWLAGNGLIIRREVLDEIGLLAEELAFLWDLEYGLRAWRAGWHAFFLREVRMGCPFSLPVPAGAGSLLAESGRYLRRLWLGRPSAPRREF